MARNSDLTQKRNDSIRLRFRTLRRQNPNWRTTAIIEQVAKEYWLEQTTVGRILKEGAEPVPCTNTILRYKVA